MLTNRTPQLCPPPKKTLPNTLTPLLRVPTHPHLTVRAIISRALPLRG
jgi:hypothetical protein